MSKTLRLLGMAMVIAVALAAAADLPAAICAHSCGDLHCGTGFKCCVIRDCLICAPSSDNCLTP